VSVQSALAFLQTVRGRPDVQAQVAAWGAAATAADLAELAERLGHPCTAAELEQAFRHDWTMRWLRHADAPSADADHASGARRGGGSGG
jgi:hypothetical protein